MSQANVEIVARGIAAINSRELSDELAGELLAPSFRIENVSTAITDKTYYGVEGVRDWMRDFFEAFGDEAIFEIEEVIAHGEGFVVAMVRLSGQGARSHAPLVLRWPSVHWFANGKQTRVVGYAHRREALKAVGLAE